MFGEVATRAGRSNPGAREAVRSVTHDRPVAVPYLRGWINRAGDALRAHQAGAAPLNYTELVGELSVVEEFRAAHAFPLTRVAAGLRYYVADASGGTFIVGQRLKRMDTIRDKLDREPGMSWSRMPTSPASGSAPESSRRRPGPRPAASAATMTAAGPNLGLRHPPQARRGYEALR